MGAYAGEARVVINYEVLLFTLGLLLGVVALTTVAAIVNKVQSDREEAEKGRFVDHVRQQLLLLPMPEHKPRAMGEIARAVSGRWAELASEEVSQLELGLRLEVVRALEEAGVVDRYLRDARSPLKWSRAHALRMLGELKVPSAVPALLRGLDDRDPDVRNVAARSLARSRLQAAEEALVALLGKHDQSISARIAAICIQMGSRTAPLLIRTLREGTPRARFWAARILGEIRDARATRSLVEALGDPDAEIRSAATWAMGAIADRSTAPVIAPLLEDAVWYVRAHAAEALGRAGDPGFVDPLGAALEDRSWWVRKNALDALVKIGAPSRSVLERALQSEDRFARDCATEGLASLTDAAIMGGA